MSGEAIGILQARMGSSRLPGKVMADLCGRPMLAHIIERLQRARTLVAVVVATTTRPEDQVIVDLAAEMGVPCFRGSAEDVLGRVARVARTQEADLIAHASGDNPLVEPEIVDEIVRYARRGGYDLAFMAGLPLGVGVDVFAKQALLLIDRLAAEPAHREHVNAYIFDHLDRFRVGRLLARPEFRRPDLRLTVDTEADLQLARAIYRRLYRPGSIIHLSEVLALYRDEPELFAVNAHVRQIYASEAARRMRGL